VTTNDSTAPTPHDRDGDGRDDRLQRDERAARPETTRPDATQRLDKDGRPVEGGHVPAHADDSAVEVLATDRKAVVRREKEEYGGVKVGSAFFGWLTATGTAVLLTALVAAGGAVFGLATDTDIAQTAEDATTSDATTVGIVGGIVLLVIIFLAYYCGGYVAGRMARFNGLKQGVAVWIWAVLIAVVVAVVAALAGDEYDVLGELNAFPRIPLTEGDLTTGGIIVAVAVAVASLLGAMVGGLAGMRFHRKVDRAGLGA
jgi:hypothetical protein